MGFLWIDAHLGTNGYPAQGPERPPLSEAYDDAFGDDAIWDADVDVLFADGEDDLPFDAEDVW